MDVYIIVYLCVIFLFVIYLKMTHFDVIEKAKIIMQKRKICHLTDLSFSVKKYLNVSCLKAEDVIAVDNKLHKWSLILFLIIDDDAALNREARLTQNSSCSIVRALRTHSANYVLMTYNNCV